MVRNDNNVAPGQSSFSSVAGGGVSNSPAPPASPSGQPPKQDPTHGQFPINAADYRAAKEAIPSVLQEASIPVDLTLKMGEKQEGPAALSLIYHVTTQTFPTGVYMNIILDIRRYVIGNPIAREGEHITIRSYKTSRHVAPGEVATQLKTASAQLLNTFCDEWQIVQGLKNDETETKDSKE